MNKETLKSNVIDSINYFERLSQNQNEREEGNRLFEWELGLFISQQLLLLVNSISPNVEALQILFKILEDNHKKFGSGWHGLYWYAKHFLDFIENPTTIEEVRQLNQ